MRRILLIIIAFVFLCFTIPVLLTKRSGAKPVDVPTEENTYTYSNYGTVKVLHKDTGEVESLGMDEYLYGVVSAEMPANYELEALKAQAIVARTYTVYKIYKGSKHAEADICDDSTCCQAWISKQERFERWNENERESNWKKITTAVDGTSGKIVTYNGEPINAFFHSNSGGTTETVSNVWGGTDYPYLQSVETVGEDGYSQYNSEVSISKEELVQKLKEKYPEIEIDFNLEDAIKILEYTESGRVRTIQFGNTNISGVEARTIFGLKSAKFNIQVGEQVTFSVLGYGHGVGLSQTGADAMAKVGSTAEQIINHYYTDIKIENI